MLSTQFMSPADICRSVAGRARAARLAADLSQEGLAERSGGGSLGTLKRFERTGAASLEVVARIALAPRLEWTCRRRCPIHCDDGPFALPFCRPLPRQSGKNGRDNFGPGAQSGSMTLLFKHKIYR